MSEDRPSKEDSPIRGVPSWAKHPAPRYSSQSFYFGNHNTADFRAELDARYKGLHEAYLKLQDGSSGNDQALVSAVVVNEIINLARLKNLRPKDLASVDTLSELWRSARLTPAEVSAAIIAVSNSTVQCFLLERAEQAGRDLQLFIGISGSSLGKPQEPVPAKPEVKEEEFKFPSAGIGTPGASDKTTKRVQKEDRMGQLKLSKDQAAKKILDFAKGKKTFAFKFNVGRTEHRVYRNFATYPNCIAGHGPVSTGRETDDEILRQISNTFEKEIAMRHLNMGVEAFLGNATTGTIVECSDFDYTNPENFLDSGRLEIEITTAKLTTPVRSTDGCATIFFFGL